MTRLLLVDDYPLFREGLRLALGVTPEFSVGGEAGSAAEALALAERAHFDLVVVDLGLPGRSGLSLIRELKRRDQSQRIAVVSMFGDSQRIADALIAGASAYMVKTDATDALLAGLRAAAAGHRFLSSAIDQATVERLVRASGRGGVVGPLDPLTQREREVFSLVTRDYSTTMIAAELGISPKTVETHREHIFRKLRVHSLCELLRFAARHHLLDLEPARDCDGPLG